MCSSAWNSRSSIPGVGALPYTHSPHSFEQRFCRLHWHYDKKKNEKKIHIMREEWGRDRTDGHRTHKSTCCVSVHGKWQAGHICNDRGQNTVHSLGMEGQASGELERSLSSLGVAQAHLRPMHTQDVSLSLLNAR